MALNADYAAFIEDLLAPFGPVIVKRMFGGGGVFHDGLMFALIADDALYLKADSETEEEFKAAESSPFVYQGKNRQVSMSYWRLPERLYENPDELAEWAGRAYAAALRAQKPARRGGARTGR